MYTNNLRIDSRSRGVKVKNTIGAVVLNIYLACVMARMIVMLLVAIAHLL